jgi:hypothetical protein
VFHLTDTLKPNFFSDQITPRVTILVEMNWTQIRQKPQDVCQFKQVSCERDTWSWTNHLGTRPFTRTRVYNHFQERSQDQIRKRKIKHKYYPDTKIGQTQTEKDLNKLAIQMQQYIKIIICYNQEEVITEIQGWFYREQKATGHHNICIKSI